MQKSLEDFIYKDIIKGLMFTSWLGRRVIMGHADSAINFTHIYRNEPKGYNRIGKFVDRILLNLPSAKATRNRRENLLETLKQEILCNMKAGRKTRIVDLASGPATYLIDTIGSGNQSWVEALCLDIDKRSIFLGRKLSKGKPILYNRGDVSRLQPYRRISKHVNWAPNLILASGLFFYYDDDFVTRLFKELYAALDGGGLLLFDNLIGNPNKKLLSKVGVMRSGRAWEFYYRAPDEIISWLSGVGFSKIDYVKDKWGMYVLYKARKGC